MTATDGRFVWYDLMTPDPDASTRFYGGVVGWRTQPFEIKGMPPYTMWTRPDDTPIGGIVRMGEEEKAKELAPHWLAYVQVADVDAAARKAEILGGKMMHEPADIPEVGRFTVISDPQGAVLALYTSLNPSDPAGPPGPGDFSWHELATTDHEAAFEFYSGLLGWRRHEAMDMGGGAIYLIYGLEDMPLGGMFTKTEEMPGPPAWLYYVAVADLDAAKVQIEHSGGEVVQGPMEVPGGDRILQAVDPQGALFALHGRSTG